MEEARIFKKIDKIREEVDAYVKKTEFEKEYVRRANNVGTIYADKNEALRHFSHLIAYSMRARSDRVKTFLATGVFEQVFVNFDIDIVSRLNPCDIIDQHWNKISAIRVQTKVFFIVSLARRMNEMEPFDNILSNTSIPKAIKSFEDIEKFWDGFDKLTNTLADHRLPIIRSTTTLLHLLMAKGYDCLKPDSVVMRVLKSLEIVKGETGERSIRLAVKCIQQYGMDRRIRPEVMDLYLLIKGGKKKQKAMWIKHFMTNMH